MQNRHRNTFTTIHTERRYYLLFPVHRFPKIVPWNTLQSKYDPGSLRLLMVYRD